MPQKNLPVAHIPTMPFHLLPLAYLLAPHENHHAVLQKREQKEKLAQKKLFHYHHFYFL